RVRCPYLSVADSFDSHPAQKSPDRREFLDPTVVGVRHQNVSVYINSNSRWGVKLSLGTSSAAFKHVSYTLRQGAELGRWCVRYLVDSQGVILVLFVLEDLGKIRCMNLFVRSLDELSLANRAIETHVLDPILF